MGLGSTLGLMDGLSSGFDLVVIALACLLQNVAHLVHPAALMPYPRIHGANRRQSGTAQFSSFGVAELSAVFPTRMATLCFWQNQYRNSAPGNGFESSRIVREGGKVPRCAKRPTRGESRVKRILTLTIRLA